MCFDPRVATVLHDWRLATGGHELFINDGSTRSADWTPTTAGCQCVREEEAVVGGGGAHTYTHTHTQSPTIVEEDHQVEVQDRSWML
ncbi:unnamed protein product [Danaus chrysippus]|uniref:(African queen) hypothetical protein n=1 Tax=Danaus chrysippus TaxID=151541 RepID=A0A8J2W0F8_9NEOP|nr:unnamed protein product [Danaus chrysippus]